MKNPIIVCEFGENIGGSIFCKVSNNICLRTRWCYTNECIRNTDGYTDCKDRDKGMKDKEIIKEKPNYTDNTKEIDEELDDIMVKKSEDSFVEDYFPVLWKKDHAFAIDFYGYGISFHTKDYSFLDTSLIGDIIKVKYSGKIGEEDFVIHPVYGE